MKKILVAILSVLCLSSGVTKAQEKSKEHSFVTLGGNKSGAKVSILQVLDYPVLVLADKNEKIKSFEITIMPSDAEPEKTTSYKVEGAKLNEPALAELKAFSGRRGKIFIDNIIVAHENINVKEKSMVFYFEN